MGAFALAVCVCQYMLVEYGGCWGNEVQCFIAPGVVSQFANYMLITVQSSGNLHEMCSLTPGCPSRRYTSSLQARPIYPRLHIYKP